MFKVCPYDFLDLIGICCHVSLFIYNFIHSYLLSFAIAQFGQEFANLFKETTLCFIEFGGLLKFLYYQFLP